MGVTVLGAVVVTLATIAGSPAVADEPSVYHRYLMKGSITAVGDDGVYLCIGTHDGAAPGQVLDVVRVRRKAGTGGKQRTGIRFTREHVGKVEIVEVVDDHFARAERVEGEAREGDVVELEAPPPQPTQDR